MAVRDLDRRIAGIFLAFVALLGLAMVKAVDFGVLKAGSLQQAAVSQQISQDVLPAPRGTITDRNGVDLAISESADDVIADDFLIKQPLATAQKLAPAARQAGAHRARPAVQAQRLRAHRAAAAG